MSITIRNLSYSFRNCEPLFEDVSLSVAAKQKVALIGSNGSGKSTLLRLVAGDLTPASGEIITEGRIYTVPQHTGQYDDRTIAAMLGIERELTALRAILAGDASDENFTFLNDGWDIEERVSTALSRWGLNRVDLFSPFGRLSGGEKTRIFLSGIYLREPSVILMDEPTNHLDTGSRRMIYDFIRSSSAALLIVSHDKKLLNLVDVTCELDRKGVKTYGGNYDFYGSVRTRHDAALQERVREEQKNLNRARRVAEQAAERKNRLDGRGDKKSRKEGLPPILMGTRRDRAETSSTKLRVNHARKLEEITARLTDLKKEAAESRPIRIGLEKAERYPGKKLVEMTGVDHSFRSGALWDHPIDFTLYSRQRLRLMGDNGSGKTTFLRILTGEIVPSEGHAIVHDFQWQYLDQEYAAVRNDLTVLEFFQRNNARKHPEHILKTELDRFLFPRSAWEKKCGGLSGGEKMRLMLCTMLCGNQVPELLILDEPTNNLDIRSTEILTEAIRNFRGTLLVVSHDDVFAREIGLQEEFSLKRKSTED